ncbi:MAG: outer membrane beta-barrel protein [Bacteroidetes bacterium]|nr:outer membrane beta-barrel protein [Bacteroidota bacterium]
MQSSKKIKHLLSACVVVLVFSTNLSAQSNVSFAIGGGVMFYNGDLSEKGFLPKAELLNLYYGGDISLLLVDRTDLSLRYMRGKVEGDDRISKENDNLARNQHFFSNIDELSALLRFRFFSVKDKRRFNPYGMFGLGYFWFRPKAELNGAVYELQPLGTEGQFIEGGDYEKPYRLTSSSLTFGAGVFMRLNDNFSLRLEAAPQLTFTDYLDDTSGSYPDSTALAATPKGELAVLFSSRRPKGFPDAGRRRGNPDRDDVIVTVGLSIVYTPGSRNSGPNSKPGIFSQMFKGRKGWWGMTPN